MSQYTSVSVNSVISRVLRNIRITDMTEADDILEWLGEGLDRMLIKSRQKRQFICLKVDDFKTELPCGTITVDAVLYNGARLSYGFGIPDPKGIPWSTFKRDFPSYFVTSVTVDVGDGTTINQSEIANTQAYNAVRGLDLKQAFNQCDSNQYYFTELNWLKTSFECGEIVLFYKVRPTDKEGYPLIPDIEEVKEGLFWYIAGKLVFSGYKLPDPRHDYVFCEDRSTKFFRQGKNIIKRMGLDEKESQLRSWVNLIPPTNYYHNIFIGSEHGSRVFK